MINADLFDRCAKVERPRSTAGAAGGFARAVYDLLEKALPVRASGARPEVRNEFATYGYEVTTTVYSFRGDWRQNDRITLDDGRVLIVRGAQKFDGAGDVPDYYGAHCEEQKVTP